MKLSRGLLAFILLCVFAIDARAQWSTWGAVVANVPSPDDVGLPGAADDGANGFVVAWSSDAAQLVYATRYNQNGTVNWGPVQVGSIEVTTPNPVQVVRQGSSWFVAWFDPDIVNTVAIHKIRVAKLDSSGSVVAAAAFSVANPPDLPVTVEDLSMVGRTGGGVAIGWRIDGDVHVRLYASDLASSIDLPDSDFNGSNLHDVSLIRVVADGSDGVLGVWASSTYPPYVKVQRYDASGTAVWANPVTMISYTAGGASDLNVASDGSGGLVAAAQWEWSSTSHVRVQWVSAGGTAAWYEAGLGAGMAICATCPEQVEPRVIVNTSHTAAIASWEQWSGGVGSVHAQRLPLTSSFAPSWGSTGVQVNVSNYFELGEHRIVQNINNQTAVVWSYRAFGYGESGFKYQIVGDDGDVELDSDAAGPALATSTPVDFPVLLSLTNGAFIGWRAYLGDYAFVLANTVLPPAIYDVEYAFDPDRCSNRVTWKTLSGSTANKIKYRHIGGTTWTSKNAGDVEGTWTVSIPQYVPTEFKMSATYASLVYESGIYQDYGACDEPDPQGAPMAEKRTVEAYLTAHPNPFNPQVIVDYGVPASAHVELAIFDASGRRIKTLVSGTKPLGNYSETWNGYSERGERVASGVYFSRLVVNGTSITQKIVMLK